MKTIFLDRDGVINRNLDNDYVKSWDEFEFLPNSRHAIKLLTDAGYQLIVVTNQACINKGIISPQTLDGIHRKMTHELKKAGGHIAAIYHCPHRDDEGCDCRKPKPGMLIEAASEHGVELTNAYLIGDSIRDIEAGQQVGCHTVLVLTGHGGKTDGQTSHKNVKPEKTCEDLYAATLWILSRTEL